MEALERSEVRVCEHRGEPKGSEGQRNENSLPISSDPSPSSWEILEVPWDTAELFAPRVFHLPIKTGHILSPGPRA